MTTEEIQAVIDKGGYLYRRFDETTGTLIFKPEHITDNEPHSSMHGINIYYYYDDGMEGIKNGEMDFWFIKDRAFREATPEEIERYVK